jgi:hypothetical protein
MDPFTVISMLAILACFYIIYQDHSDPPGPSGSGA